MPQTVTRTQAGLASALRISINRLARRLRSQRADFTLSGTQLAALATLDHHGMMSPRALAEHEKVQPPSMTRVIAELEARGLVERNPHATDRRQVVLALTEAGRQLLAEDRRRREAWLSQRLRELTPEERAILRDAAPILEKLSQA